tara:strand:+ start:263 stop:616 length:354 start_codon:yes stop_codon:yes gene_type:complete
MVQKSIEWYRKTYIRDRYKCVYCARDLKNNFYDWMLIEIDHVIPKSKNGSDNPENIVTSCRVCNRFKGIYLPQNYKSLSRNELIEDIKNYIKKKTEEWKETHQEALKEFEEKISSKN